MKVTWVLLLAVGVVTADIGLGYHYKAPQTSFGIPSYQLGDNLGQYSSAYSSSLGSGNYGSGSYGSGNFGSSSLSSGSLSSGGLSTANLGSANLGSASLGSANLGSTTLNGFEGLGYSTGGLHSAGLGSGYYQSLGSGSSAGTFAPAYHYSGNSALGTGFQSQYASGQYQSAEKYQQNVQVQQQPTQVFKHFYVHAAPEEPEVPKARAPIVLPPAQKHYKIIFVKTPTESHRSQAVVPVQPQNEEKTIVYVLVKKPEDHHEVIVPKIEQKPPSKPEVYFIKYKNKEDSQAVINNIVKDYNQGQQVSFVNTGANAVVNSGLNSGFNSVAHSGIGETGFNSIASAGESTFSTASTLGDSSFNGASGFGNVHYDAPVQSDVSASSQGFGVSGVSSVGGVSGVQESSYNLASANSGSADLNNVNIVSTLAPVTVSSTVANVDYDAASAISTSQGIPHENYGPPKFRAN